MNTPKARDILEKALEHLEDVVERKILYMESENNKLKAEVIKLKSELKKISEAPFQKSIELTPPSETITSNSSPASINATLIAQPQQQEVLSDVHISLSKLKRLVS